MVTADRASSASNDSTSYTELIELQFDDILGSMALS